ncbi:hypothetical protein ACRAWF_42970 [Streptomyces sp. L7]
MQGCARGGRCDARRLDGGVPTRRPPHARTTPRTAPSPTVAGAGVSAAVRPRASGLARAPFAGPVRVVLMSRFRAASFSCRRRRSLMSASPSLRGRRHRAALALCPVPLILRIRAVDPIA